MSVFMFSPVIVPEKGDGGLLCFTTAAQRKADEAAAPAAADTEWTGDKAPLTQLEVHMSFQGSRFITAKHKALKAVTRSILTDRGGRSTQIFYLSKSSNTTVQKYSKILLKHKSIIIKI